MTLERLGESGATHDSQSASRSGVEAWVARNLNGWDDSDAGLSNNIFAGVRIDWWWLSLTTEINLNLVVFGGSLRFCDTVDDDASDVSRQCRRSHYSLVATDGLLTLKLSALLNQLLVLMSDSAILAFRIKWPPALTKVRPVFQVLRVSRPLAHYYGKSASIIQIRLQQFFRSEAK